MTTSVPKTAVEATSGDFGRVWRVFLETRPGPPRRETITIDGQRLKVTKRKMFDFPPGPNERLHYRVKAKWVAEWRKAMADAVRLEHRIPPLGRVRLSAVVYRLRLGQADEDNDRARLKPLVDGLRDAGVIPDDTRGYVEWGSVTEGQAGKGQRMGVLLIVEPVPPREGE